MESINEAQSACKAGKTKLDEMEKTYNEEEEKWGTPSCHAVLSSVLSGFDLRFKVFLGGFDCVFVVFCAKKPFAVVLNPCSLGPLTCLASAVLLGYQFGDGVVFFKGLKLLPSRVGDLRTLEVQLVG